MDNLKNKAAKGNPVVIWLCNSSDKAQQWVGQSDGTIRLKDNTKFCLDVTGQKTADRSTVGISTCNGGTNQQWTLQTMTTGAGAKSGLTELLGKQSNKCLDVKANSTTNGTQLEIFTCTGGNNQAWSWNGATSVKPPTGTTNSGTVVSNLKFGSTTTNLCMANANNKVANGNPVVTAKCAPSDKAQQWVGKSDGTIQIKTNTKYCLDVTNKKTADNSTVGISACNGQTNQQWNFTTIANGAAKGLTQLVGKQSGKCLDITKASTAGGTHLEIYHCTGGKNQAWSWNTSGVASGGGSSGGGGTTTTKWAYLAPTGLKATKHSANSLTVVWNKVTGSKPTIKGGVPAPKGYTVAVYRSGSQIRNNTTTALTYTENGLTKGGTVVVHVWANGGPLAPPNASVTVVLTK